VVTVCASSVVRSKERLSVRSTVNQHPAKARGNKDNMTDSEIRTFHEAREIAFAGIDIPHSAISAANAQLRHMELQRCLNALPVYRAERPYKGFYMTRFNLHYLRQPATATDRAGGAAAPTGNDDLPDGWAIDNAYARIPAKVLAEVSRRYSAVEWDRTGRCWKVFAIDAAAGKDVSAYVTRPMRPAIEGAPTHAEATVSDHLRRERNYVTRIHQLEALLIANGINCKGEWTA
jgi:hypothetical protein